MDTMIRGDDPICTCGEKFQQHTTGRCADALLHKLFFGEEAELSPPGTEVFDGLRAAPLFDEEYTYVNKDEDRVVLPYYTAKPELSFVLFSRWYDMGGTGELRMNKSGWSARFHHSVVRVYGYYQDNYIKRTRLEWLPIRTLAFRAINFYRQTLVDDCTWIDGIEPVEEEEDE